MWQVHSLSLWLGFLTAGMAPPSVYNWDFLYSDSGFCEFSGRPREFSGRPRLLLTLRENLHHDTFPTLSWPSKSQEPTQIWGLGNITRRRVREFLSILICHKTHKEDTGEKNAPFRTMWVLFCGPGLCTQQMLPIFLWIDGTDELVKKGSGKNVLRVATCLLSAVFYFSLFLTVF